MTVDHLAHFHVRVDPAVTLFTLVPRSSLHHRVRLLSTLLSRMLTGHFAVFRFVHLKGKELNTLSLNNRREGVNLNSTWLCVGRVKRANRSLRDSAIRVVRAHVRRGLVVVVASHNVRDDVLGATGQLVF